MKIKDLHLKVSLIRENVEKVIVGKSHVINCVLTALLSNGHILLEDVPGTGKTMLAKSLAKSIDADFNRIQFTPDLLPSDITGLNYFNGKENKFLFRKGPVFTNLLLADEINRATPRTQSSLLECMEEKQVTIDGVTTILDAPFLVIATQNPVETAGTYPLPEAQLDRFLMQISIGVPNKEEETDILKRFIDSNPYEILNPVCSKEELREMQNLVKTVFVHPSIMDYIVEIVSRTRTDKNTALGVSPRGSLAFMRVCQSYAAINGRTYVIPEDVKDMAPNVLSHRIILHTSFNTVDTTHEIISRILKDTIVPTEDFSKL